VPSPTNSRCHASAPASHSRCSIRNARNRPPTTTSLPIKQAPFRRKKKNNKNKTYNNSGPHNTNAHQSQPTLSITPVLSTCKLVGYSQHVICLAAHCCCPKVREWFPSGFHVDDLFDEIFEVSDCFAPVLTDRLNFIFNGCGGVQWRRWQMLSCSVDFR